MDFTFTNEINLLDLIGLVGWAIGLFVGASWLKRRYSPSGLFGPDTDSGLGPNIRPRDGGYHFPGSNTYEHYSHAVTSGHTSVPNGERHADTGLPDGNGH